MTIFSKALQISAASAALVSMLMSSAQALPQNQSIIGCAKFGIQYKCAVWRGGRCLKKVPVIVCLKRDRPVAARR